MSSIAGRFRLLLVLFVFAPLSGQGAGDREGAPPVRAAADRWEPEIRAFEELDRKTAPPSDAVLFIGSSSIRRWSTLAKDFDEVPIINRGFGGSQIADSTRYVERIVLPYKPRLIVLYAGSNDINAGKTPAEVFDDFREFAGKVQAGLPDARIAFISINPNIARWKHRESMQEANRLIAEYAREQPGLAFIDSYSAFLGADGEPRRELLDKDNLHLSPEGYAVWTSVVKPEVLALYDEAKRGGK